MKLSRMSRNVWASADQSVEIVARESGKKVRDGRFSGTFSFSSKHGDMMPHEPTYSIYINDDLRVRDIFEDEIQENIRRLGYQI